MISILVISLFSIAIGFNIRNKKIEKNINNNLKESSIKRNLEKTELISTTIIENMTEQIEINNTEKSQIVYYINIAKYDYEYNKFSIFATSQPRLSSDISLLVTSKIIIYSNNESKIITETRDIVLPLIENNELLKFSKDFGSSIPLQIEILKAEVIHNDDNVYKVELLKGKFIIQDPTDEIIDTTIRVPQSNSSGRSYVWVIIVSIIGVSILIVGFILIFRCIRKRKQIPTVDNRNSIAKINDSEKDVNQLNQLNAKKLTFVLKLPNVSEIRLTIDGDKELKVLAKSYLETINRPDLINENSIYFMCEGKFFDIFSDKLVGNEFKDENKIYHVAISDTNDKIK